MFEKFLDDLGCGYADRKIYLLSMLNIILLSKVNFQVVIYLYGPGASGKSQLTSLLKALIGNTSVMSTTLDALSHDKFEIINFLGKKLILVNDSDGSLKNSSTVKAYSGNDELRGRNMFQALTQNIMPEGLMVIVSNNPIHLEQKDFNNGLSRRMKTYETFKTTNSRTPLITRFDNKWEGPLVKELSAIYNKITSLQTEIVEKYINSSEAAVPSLRESFDTSKKNFNNVGAWMSE